MPSQSYLLGLTYDLNVRVFAAWYWAAWIGWVLEEATDRHFPGKRNWPFKANAERRHRIPKQQFRATTWAEYDAALRWRGSLTVRLTQVAIMAWKAKSWTTRGVFHLALRQTEGPISSIIGLLGLELAVPDHSAPSRRAKTPRCYNPRLEPTPST